MRPGWALPPPAGVPLVLFVSYCYDSVEGSGRLWAGLSGAWVIALHNPHGHTSEA